jgi:F420-dependent oxidoreductase-like protein
MDILAAALEPERVMAAEANDARIGVALGVTKQVGLEMLIKLAQLAESLGYESIWVPETWGTDAVSVLAVLARETERIRIAAGVLNVYSRSAALIAQTAATLQELSGGRFILGLGASGPIVVEKWHGLPYRRPIGRTQDYVKTIRLALTGKPLDSNVDGVDLAGFSLQNPPSVAIPIYIAALGPQNVRLTASVADGWLPIFAARGHTRPLVDDFDEASREVGRDPDHIDVAALIPTLLGDSAERLLRQQIAYYVGGMGTFYHDFVQRMGFADEATQIAGHWRRNDRLSAVSAVSSNLLSSSAVTGTVALARDAIDEFRAEGIKLPIIAFPHGSSPEGVAATIEALAPRKRLL